MRGLHRRRHAESRRSARGPRDRAAARARCAAAGDAKPSGRESPRARPAPRDWPRRRLRAPRARARRRSCAARGPRSSSALRSASPRPASAKGSSSEAVREPSVPSANALTGPMRSHSSPRPLRSPSAMISSSRSAGSDAHTRSDRRRSAWRRCQAARPCSRWKSWMPVTPRACAARRPRARASSSPCSLRRRQRRGRIPRGGLAQHAGGRARLVALDDGCRPDRQPGERGRRQPGGVVIVCPEHHRPISAGGVQGVAVRLRVSRGPVRRAPPGTDQPAALARRGACRGRKHLGVRARAREIEPRE